MKAKQFRAMTKEDVIAYANICAERSNLPALAELNVFRKYLDKRVKVVRGRKVPIGTVGTVFWIGAVNYSKYKKWWSWQFRVGLKDNDGNTYFTAERNIELVEQDER